MPREAFDLPVIGRAAAVVPATINEEERTVEVCWTTGATVQRLRFEGWDIKIVDEELAVDEQSIRLERLRSGAPFLNSHNGWSLDAVLGVVVEDSVRLEGGRGYARIRFSEREDVEPIWRDIKAGIIRNVSVGYRVHEYRITEKDGERDHYLAVDWEPMEISAVAIGADPEAQMRSQEQHRAPNTCVLTRQDGTAAAAAEQKGTTMSGKNKAAASETGHDRSNEQGIETREGGKAPATPETPKAPAAEEKRAAPGGEQPKGQQPAAEQPSEERGTDAETVAQRAVAAERERTGTITELCRRHGLDGDFEQELIRTGATVAQAREKVLDKIAERDPFEGRSYEPAQPRREDGQAVGYRDAVTSALLHRHNPGAHDLTDGAREYRGMSLLEMARDALERQGVRTRGMSKLEIAGAVFEQRAAGYHSTSDFPAILANVANKTLRSAYETTPRTFSAWCRRATITDFKPVQRTQLSGAPDLEKVLESGEFQYGTMGESKETYALATYGKIIGITRQTLINDDLDAFTRIPTAFGASAADLESDIVYAILMQNPKMGDGTALFHSNHGNLGSAAVIDESSLTAAYRKYAQQTGIEGRKISVDPRYIIVPPGQRAVEARKHLTATTPASTSDVNTYANRLQVVEERRLIPSSGQDPWFLSADPARIDTVEYAYLDGQEGVFTETRMGFEVDGMEIKARHDFAAKAIDWRGLFKNPGAAPA